MDRDDMHRALEQAIAQRRRLRMNYLGKARFVEPQCYGIGTRGTRLLRVYQPRGGSVREPLFDVAKIENLVTTAETFDRPGPNYRRGDSAMVTIFCEL